MVFALSGENLLWFTIEDKRNLVFIVIIFFFIFGSPSKLIIKKNVKYFISIIF